MSATTLPPDDPDAAQMLLSHRFRKMGEAVVRSRMAVLARMFVAGAAELDHGTFCSVLVSAVESLQQTMVADLGKSEVTELAIEFFLEEAAAERNRLIGAAEG